MDHHGDPPHDRVTLTAQEHTALAGFELSFGEEGSRGRRDALGRARLAGSSGFLGRVATRFVRLSPWLALLGCLALPPSIAVSEVAGLVCALFTTAAVTTWVVARRGRCKRWLAEQIDQAEKAERRRAEGQP
jgi:hypothetical protein